MHAVIVDSSRVVLKMIAKHFTERGDAFSLYSDSAEALDHIQQDSSVNVLLTSLEVEPISGLELCWQARLLAEPRRPLYIAVMSSLNDTQNLAQALDSGADDMLPKPVSRQQLHARLRMAERLHGAQLELVRLAETDTLTGVSNRGAFFRKAQALLKKSNSPPMISAIMFDIDHFKKVNDTHGHPAGDEVIKTTAQEAAKIDGIIGRLGGEEFAIIVHDLKKAEVMRIAENLRERCARLIFKGDDIAFHITCSIGVSRWVKDDTLDTLLKRADLALYEAKAGGRNRVCFADPRTTAHDDLQIPVRSSKRS